MYLKNHMFTHLVFICFQLYKFRTTDNGPETRGLLKQLSREIYFADVRETAWLV